MPAEPATSLLVIGAQRCGTSFLADVLEAHPDVALAQPRRPEPKVFLADEVVERGLDWYHATWFGHATTERVLAEKSTSYLEHPAAIPRVRAVLGDPWIVVQLRDPVARAVSNWRFSRDNGIEDLPLVDALRADLAGTRDWDGGRFSVSPFRYVRRGRYADDLAAWHEAFPGRVVVTFLEEVSGSAAGAREVYARLGLPDHDGPVPAWPVNASSEPAVPLDEGVLSELRGYYRDSDTLLVEMLGRELPWRNGAEEAG